MVLQSLARGFEINGNVYTWLCVGLGLHHRYVSPIKKYYIL